MTGRGLMATGLLATALDGAIPDPPDPSNA